MKFQIQSRIAIQLMRLCVGMMLGFHVLSSVSQPLVADDAARNAAIPLKYELKPEHGPWLVFAMSFDGYDAKTRAEALANELKRDFKLQAYCMAKKLDFTQPVAGVGFDENGNNRKMRFREKKVIDGYAVLVGDFDSIDSQAMTDALNKIKTITPKSLTVEGVDQQDLAKKDSVPVHTWRNFMKLKNDVAPEKQGPMSSAFTTRNPLLPDDFYKTPEVDKFVKKLNEESRYAEHNLLGCPGKFTVRVAVFSGEDRGAGSWGRASSVQDNADENKVSQLEIAAERAALAAKALRKAGYEAYQFHDRTQSIVTVGSFNELGKVDQRNRFVYDQLIQEIVTRFGATSQVTRTQYGVTQTPRILFDLVNQKQIPELNEGDEKSRLRWFAKYSIPFDVKPAPMAVPRPAAASIYSGSLLGKDRR